MWKVQDIFGQVLTNMDGQNIVQSMYGKIFESLYEGSMVGSGAKTFAVWGYVIAHMRKDDEVGAQVEINPKLLGFILGELEEDIVAVIEALCSPDPSSRTPDEGGRRLIRMGQYSYRVVNGAKYMDIRNAEERREYFRNAKRKERADELQDADNHKPKRTEYKIRR